MPGVEILAQNEIYTADKITCTIGIIGFFVALIFGIICVFLMFADVEKAVYVTFGIFVIGVLMFGFAKIKGKTEYAYTEYKVTISDEVSMNEFSEKYEILSQDGKIYTVKERSE